MGYYSYIINKIEKENPIHAKKLKNSYSELDEAYKDKFEAFFQRYERMLFQSKLNLDYAVSSYLRFCGDMLSEQMNFLRTGKYSNTSFEEVNKNVYDNPEVMNYHMHGLLVSQFLWTHHYQTFRFFTNRFKKYAGLSNNILEVGGGHGLYTSEVLTQLQHDYTFDMVDISASSIALSKSMVDSNRINYHLQDIYAFNPRNKFDFIIMGEVLEHVEDPVALMKKLNEMGASDAKGFITTPCNAPSIDHIYLFRNSEEVKEVMAASGWRMVEDFEVYSEPKKAHKNSVSVPMIYAAFIQKK